MFKIGRARLPNNLGASRGNAFGTTRGEAGATDVPSRGDARDPGSHYADQSLL
jgi:hypothetical protein